MSASRAVPVSLDQLAALNDEIAALVRAGVPLEPGLRMLSADLPGRLGRIAGALSDRLESGQSLADAIESGHASFPPAYRAVLIAGLRSGRLSAALEGVSSTARRAVQLRNMTIASMIYPLLLLAIASGLLQFTTSKTLPIVVRAFAWSRVEPPPWMQLQITIAQLMSSALPWIGAAVTLGIVAWLIQSQRAIVAGGGRFREWLAISRMVRAGRLATFADLLALLIEQEVPLHEALPLAADATGDRRLMAAGRQLAEQLARGQRPQRPVDDVPPLLQWLLIGGFTTEQLVESLRRTADGYRLRGQTIGNWLTVYLPILIAAVVGGGAALFYVTMVLGPFYYLLHHIG